MPEVTVIAPVVTGKRKKPHKAFRVDREKFGFTWSCPVDEAEHPFDKGHSRAKFVLEWLLKELQLIHGPEILYTISQEEHVGGKHHYHAWIKGPRFETTNPRKWDFGDPPVHPNIITPGRKWEDYVAKGENGVAKVIGENLITNHWVNSVWARAAESKTAEAGAAILWAERPRDMLMYAHNITRNLETRLAGPVPSAPEWHGPYQIGPFVGHSWETRSMLIWGEPNGGKTQLAGYLLRSLRDPQGAPYKVFTVNGNINRLRQWNGRDALLFNDCYFTEAGVDHQLSRIITDVVDGGTVRVLYGAVTIPPGVPRIFTANCEHPFRNPYDAVYGRRVTSYYWPGPSSGSSAAVVSQESDEL